MTDLSICIPTYNRSEQVKSLVETLLSVEGSFELCVHDDGSTDDTFARLSAFDDPRLRLSRDRNGGRGQALQKAIRKAEGRYIMVFDDDDFLYPEGLKFVLKNCASRLPETSAGWIYQLEDDKGFKVGSDFPLTTSNFLALRADQGVTGDKKEVVLRSVLLGVLAVPGQSRRIPTSLYWSRIALTHDVLCRNCVIGKKTYLEGGMSDRIQVLKSSSPRPMFLLAHTRIHAFLLRRYRSPKFLTLSLAAYLVYGTRSLLHEARKISHG